MGEKDIVWDYDAVITALTGKTAHTTEATAAHRAVMAMRRALFYQLTEREQPIETAWILSHWPGDTLREQLPDAKYVEMETTEAECLKRLKADETRPDKKAWAKLIKSWFKEHKNEGEKRAMKIEIRADGAHISGYVNATEKKSRPVMTPHGKVVEEIEPRAFEGAIKRAGNITVSVDHDQSHIYAQTQDGTLQLYEDEIGLHADVLITDPDVTELAKKGKIRGWSFGMYNVKDEMVEPRADELPLRKIKELDLDHITLVVKKNPIYSATSMEIRADAEIEMETRTSEQTPQITEVEPKKPDALFFDNSAYRTRADKVKKIFGGRK
ncbi:MAG: HK97 family phage prohead protease [Oscillospiraceae bacterium]|nr:HK97 family phage prohead protease [Oscillospiraceae bacterium]